MDREEGWFAGDLVFIIVGGKFGFHLRRGGNGADRCHLAGRDTRMQDETMIASRFTRMYVRSDE